MIDLERLPVARTREFDEDTMLAKAMHAFRRQGFAGISIKELEAATDLSAGSIYNSYGDKNGLFAAALAHYNRTVLARRLSDHASAEAGLEGLRSLFLSLLAEPGGGSYGCLITNTAIELGGDRPVPRAICDGLRALSATFAARLTEAQSAAALRRRVDPQLAAEKLLALYQGILVLVRAGHDKGPLATMINAEFDGLKEPADGA